MLAALMPDEPEVLGLLALMLLQDSRREARADGTVLLDEQDRSLWNREQIAEGLALLRPDVARPVPAPGAIAACHAGEASDWPRIVALYDELLRLHPSPVVELNRAVAVAMADGPEAGLEAIDRIDGLDGYLHLHTARADAPAPARPRRRVARRLRARARARPERGRAAVHREPASVRNSGDRLDLEQRAGNGERRDLDEGAARAAPRRRTPCRTGLIFGRSSTSSR